MTIMEITVKKVGDHYEAGLLWRSDHFKFPPSYQNALKRFNIIEKKMQRNKSFQKEYTNKVTDYIKKGYVRKLSDEETKDVTDRTYYLHHFGVTNPNKLRLVFDVAAKSNGVSFNDALLSGPDFLNPLPSVLLSFRLKNTLLLVTLKKCSTRFAL